jgi:hypothetical protein
MALHFDDMDHLCIIVLQLIDFPNTVISPAIQPQLVFFYLTCAMEHET